MTTSLPHVLDVSWYGVLVLSLFSCIVLSVFDCCVQDWP